MVVAVGSRVTEFKKGDGVVTSFTQDHTYGSMTPKTMATNLGGILDGTFRNYGIFIEHGLVHKPKNLNFKEASTLSCAAVTAWNSLYGLKPVQSGDTVLVQGSGGVSVFALQVGPPSVIHEGLPSSIYCLR
jgi:NADPH:quinone reductase-like Zn-dependent oxidoreductase